MFRPDYAYKNLSSVNPASKAKNKLLKQEGIGNESEDDLLSKG